MRKIIVLLSFVITLLVISLGNLYSNISAFTILLNTIIISLCIRYSKSKLLIQGALLFSLVIFEILLFIGIRQVSLPVEEQSMILGILMMIFLIIQIGVTVLGITIVLIGGKFSFNRYSFIVIILSTVLTGLYFTLKNNVFVYLAFAILLIYSIPDFYS